MRVAIYARCSTNLGQRPEIQVDELKTIAKNRGWEVCYEYVDVLSGAKGYKQRPSLNNLMTDAVKGRFDVVMVWSIDRLARSVEHFVRITNELNSLGVKLFFSKESIDGSTPTGKALLQMCAVVAELERSLISERVSLGIKASIKRNGKWHGRPSNLTKQVEEKIIQLRNQGVGIRKIARENKVGVQSVYNVLKLAS